MRRRCRTTTAAGSLCRYRPESHSSSKKLNHMRWKHGAMYCKMLIPRQWSPRLMPSLLFHSACMRLESRGRFSGECRRRIRQGSRNPPGCAIRIAASPSEWRHRMSYETSRLIACVAPHNLAWIVVLGSWHQLQVRQIPASRSDEK